MRRTQRTEQPKLGNEVKSARWALGRPELSAADFVLLNMEYWALFEISAILNYIHLLGFSVSIAQPTECSKFGFALESHNDSILHLAYYRLCFVSLGRWLVRHSYQST